MAPSLEEIMAGLFGSNAAPAADDPRRRGARGAGQGGYEGIGGAAALPGQMLPYLTGARNWDYSGAMGRDFQGGGLMAMLAHEMEGGRGGQSPALRHFANQGFDFFPPGQDNQNQLAGPNLAPGNIDSGVALNQELAPHPGVPFQGGAQPPGQVGPPPHTQGWRNYAPGYSAAAQLGYGTPEFGSHFAPGQAMPPGALGGGGTGIGAGGASKGVEQRGGLAGLIPGNGGGQQAPDRGPQAQGGGQAAAAGPGAPASAPRAGSGAPAAKGGGRQQQPSGRQISAKKGGSPSGAPASTGNGLPTITKRAANADAGGKKGGPTLGQVLGKKSGGFNTKPGPDTNKLGLTQRPNETHAEFRARTKAKADAQRAKEVAQNKSARAAANESQQAANEARSNPINTPGSTTTASGGKTKKKGGAKTTVLASGRTVLT